jgi:predicted PurR-regulated permease PerM
MKMKQEKVIADISYQSILRFFLVCFSLLFVWYIKDVLVIVFIAVLLALIMEPAVDKMWKRYKIPRVFGAGLLFSLTLLALGLIVYVAAPPLAHEIGQMGTNMPGYIQRIDYQSIMDNGHSLGLSSSDLQDILLNISASLKNAASYLVAGTLSLLGGIISAVLIMVIAFYLVLEDNGIEKFVRAAVPEEFQPQCMHTVKKIEKKLGHWFIGQISLGVIVGLLSFIGLTLIGVPYALVLAIVAGTFELVPYIGPTLSAIPAVIIGATVSPTVAAMVFILYFFIQEFENYLIVPKVMEKSVGLHPVVIIIAATIGGQLGGVAGMILAVPIATILSIIVADIKEFKSEKNN